MYYTPMNALHESLRKFGLSERETTVYLLLLSLGKCPASIVARRAALPVSTAKYTCDELLEKGVVRVTRQRGTAVYVPEDPEKLLLLLDRRRADLERDRERLQSVMGELKSLINPHAVLPKVEFFEGIDGVVDGFHKIVDSLDPGEAVCSFMHPFGGVDDMFDLDKPFTSITEAFRKKRVVDRIICPRTPLSEEFASRSKGIRHVRLYDGQRVDNPTEILIFRDRLYAVAAERQQIFGFMAQNHSIAELLRSNFHALWDRLEDEPR